MNSTEIINSLIGFYLIFNFTIFARFLSTCPEYLNLVKATEKLIGCIRYSLFCFLKKLNYFFSFDYELNSYNKLYF